MSKEKPSKLELAKKQIRLQEKIQRKANINIVSCGHCGAVLLHNRNKYEIICYGCHRLMAVSDCPDYWYEGMSLTEFEN